MGKYTYYYFNARGRAETPRLIFAASGTSFEDKRLTQEEWLAFKPKTPTGQMPVLEVQGQMIPQSLAISRYLARKTGLAGKSDIDQAQVDAIADTVTEIREEFARAAFSKDESKKVELISAFKEKLPDYLKQFEAKLNKGQKFLYGKSLTWADLHLFTLLEGIAPAAPDALNDFPSIQDLQKRISELPKVAKYLKSRPETPF